MHVLITGGAGYIGSHVAISLIEQGHSVTIFDNFSNSWPEIAQRLQGAMPGGALQIVHGDIRDPVALRRALSQPLAQSVVHLAALKSIPDSFRDPGGYFDVNLTGTKVLLGEMARLGVTRLIFGSTAAVYDAGQPMPLSEASFAQTPASPYGASKLAAETYLRGLAQGAQDWSIGVLRCFNPIGAHASGLIGQASRQPAGGIMEALLKAALRQVPGFRLCGTDFATADGSALRDYLHVMDLAEAFTQVNTALRQRTGYHLWNLGSGRPTSVRQLIAAYETAIGRRLVVEAAPPRDGDLPICWCVSDWLQQDIGWHGKRSLMQMMRDDWAWGRIFIQMMQSEAADKAPQSLGCADDVSGASGQEIAAALGFQA